MAYALDANIIIHLLRDTQTVISQFDKILVQRTPIIIPPYVDFEIRRGLRYANATAKEKIYQKLCDSCEIGEMRRETWIYAASLYKTHPLWNAILNFIPIISVHKVKQ